MKESGVGAVADIAAQRVFSPSYLAAHPEKIGERKAGAARHRPEGLPCRRTAILQEVDLSPLLSRLKLPDFGGVRRTSIKRRRRLSTKRFAGEGCRQP